MDTCMALSGRWLKRERMDGQPQLKGTNHLDFLRAEPCHVTIPIDKIVYDDGELETERATSLKAYVDVGCPDPKIYARCGAACLVMHQFRVACARLREHITSGLRHHRSHHIHIHVILQVLS